MKNEPVQFGEKIEDPLERVSVYAVIINDEKKVLVVEVNGTYHLPGGGIDEEEDEKEALEREVLEETGYSLSDLQLIGKANQYLPKASLGPMNKLGTFYTAKVGVQDLSKQVEDNHEPMWVYLDEIVEAVMPDVYKWAINKAASE